MAVSYNEEDGDCYFRIKYFLSLITIMVVIAVMSMPIVFPKNNPAEINSN